MDVGSQGGGSGRPVPISEVEALLRADEGRAPAGTMTFFARADELVGHAVCVMAAVAVDLVALSGALAGVVGRAPVALLGVIGAVLAWRGVPGKRRSPAPPGKRPALVITPHGMIVREASGLRVWRFDELAEVRPYVSEGRSGILIVRRDGAAEFVDTLSFERGERVREVVKRRLASA